MESEEFQARDYQVDLYEKALAANSIIYLPTGSGKTYITVMLIKAMSQAVRIPYSKGGKRTIFAVNTVPLVAQQSAYITRHTDLTCQGYSGEMGVDYWTGDKWKEQFEQYQVLVLTAQIFLDILNHGYMSLNRVNLIIFDECHRAVKDHAMRQIMKAFQNYPEGEHPRILGTSATLLNSNVKIDKVCQTVEELEITFHAKVITVDSMAPVKGYGKPKQNFVKYDPPPTTIDKRVNIILDYMTKVLDSVELKEFARNEETSFAFQPKRKNEKLRNLIVDAKEHIDTLGLYGGSKAVLLHMLQFEKLKRSVDDYDTLIVLNFLICQMTLLRKIMEGEMNKKLLLDEDEKIFQFSTDKLLKLLKTLLAYKIEDDATSTTDNKFCTIIFVRRRFTAKVLFQILKNLANSNKEYSFIKSDYVVGYSSNPYKNCCEDMCIAKWNKDALIRFRTGVSNCLIATDVVDEGVDIPLCSLVIRYDLPMDFRAYVQSKGRARSSSSNYVMMMCSSDLIKEKERHTNYSRIESLLRNYLIGNSDNRSEPVPEDLQDLLYATEIKPYTVTDASGTPVTLFQTSVISLIHRYCNTLTRSKFVMCLPTIKLHKFDGGTYQVSIKMPIVSPLREEIRGEIMPSIMLAKRSAAMNVCIRLHQMGELTDRLLPKDTKDFIEDATHLLTNWRDESDNVDKVLIGTYGYNRPHTIIYPEELFAAYPQANSPSYLHIIDVKPTYEKPGGDKHRDQVFFEFLNDSAGFAILSSKKISQISEFPVFMNVGSLKVNIKVNHKETILSSEQIDQLKNFHWNIFKDVLNVVKKFTIFDSENRENNYLIVPVDRDWNINWNIVKEYQEILEVTQSEGTEPHEAAIASALSLMGFTGTQQAPRNYDDWQLVRPTYRDTVYIVTEICYHMNPLTTFPTVDYRHYIHYYAERHGLKISNNTQPLLEVKAISTNINYIKPRGRSSSSKKRERDNFEEHLVPELCYKKIFPRLYWLKAMYIPSVLHRLSQMLMAEDLRKRIVREAGLGVIEVAKGGWPRLEISTQMDNLNSSDSSDRDLDEEEDHDLIDDNEVEADLQMDNSVDQVDDACNMENTRPDVETKLTPEVDILSLDTSFFQLGPKDKEPIDLERNIDDVQLIDIEYYYSFVNHRATTMDIIKNKFHRKKFIKRPDIPVPPLSIINTNESFSKSSLIGPTPLDIMYALTTKLAKDAFNLERLETLGDSFLKYIASAYLFERYPFHTEGRLTIYKGQIVGNRHLFYCGDSKLIPGRLKIDDFDATSNFIPPCSCVPREIQRMIRENKKLPNVLYNIDIDPFEQKEGKLSDETRYAASEKILSWRDESTTLHTGTENYVGIQIIKDKTVSDSVEALIGVYLNAMSLPGATKLVKWLGILPQDTDINQILFGKVPSAQLGTGDPNIHMPWAESIEETLGYKFNDRSFLLQAFTHPSYSSNAITADYQRLEFLGDAIIDFLITVHIYESCGELSPGDLTDLRSALVNNITFACLSVKYGLHTALLAYAPTLTDAIDKFVKFQEEKDHRIDDNLHWTLLEEDECNMAEHVEVPKMLGDLFESIIGAIYLDTDKNIRKVWEILYSMMHNEIQTYSKKIPKDPVKLIHETQGTRPKFLRPEVIEGASSTMVPLEVIIAGKKKLFHGFGATKKQAKRAAAKQALKFVHRSLQP